MIDGQIDLGHAAKMNNVSPLLPHPSPRLFSHTPPHLVPTRIASPHRPQASKESAAASAAEPAGAAAAAADGGNADDPMDVSDRPTTGDSSSKDTSKDTNGKAGNKRAPGAGLKRPLDPLASDNAIETVRNIRRRLVLGAPDDGDGDDDDDGSGVGATPPSEEQEASLEINNADLAELLRSTKPRGDPRKWARVLFRAQNSRKGVHA